MDRDQIEQSDSIHGLIIQILKKNKEPLSMEELSELIFKQRKLKTKTPKHTLRGILQRSKFIKKNIWAKYELIDNP